MLYSFVSNIIQSKRILAKSNMRFAFIELQNTIQLIEYSRIKERKYKQNKYRFEKCIK